ncbi:CHASE2 domain-containing protein [Nostoc sp. FACHB-133]|uniref:CHASE2 domain-containing protein n=1 Tax=Nostoc sp. FACHB-133 TaxID=2692835 RepID=UPI00168312F8|nr:CHASE2 domain-containing protein [Nostoc sp. FACHB-133]MBD2526467.1 CHASE2 domain-containing protein [Nostoc sp. FACHB-133]
MLTLAQKQSIEIFFSYSQEDRKLRDKLANHLSILKHQKVINDWHEGEISAGQVSADEIERHLNSASIILLLISSDFLASEKLWQRDVTLAMRRHNDKEACVIPVLLRPCEWKSAQFGDLQALPKNEEAITSWQNQDEAFKEVAKEIRKAIEAKSDYISIPQTSKRRFKIPWRSLRNTLFASVPITLLVIVMRVMGIFEASELLLFDRIMQNQPTEPQDSKLLLVEITDDDRKHYSSDKNKYEISQNAASLSDKVIFQLLDKLIQKKPRVVGVDIYRDFSAYYPKLSELFKNKEKSKLLIFVCKFPYFLKEKDKGVDPPPETDVSIEQVGLSDLLDDSTGVIRRQLVTMPTPKTERTKNSKCRNNKSGEMESFSFKVAQKYLATDDKFKPYSMDVKDKFLKSGNTVLQQLAPHTSGGYKLNDYNGYQILLNYRFVKEDAKDSPDNLAQRISVKDVLDGKISDDDIKNKIVLIGTPSEGFDAAHATPFSSTKEGGEKMRGLYLQAQMVSQLVSAVSDQPPRPLLKVGSSIDEILLILIGSIVGSILPQLSKKSRYFLFILGGSYLFCILSFYLICYLFFSLSTKRWIPFFSPTSAFTLSVGVVIILVELQSPKKIKPQQHF